MLELSTSEAERLAESGSAKEVSSFLLKGKIDGKDAISEELGELLTGRLIKSAYLPMLGRLLGPLMAPAAATILVRPLNDALALGINTFHSALIFLSAIGAGALAGRTMADSYQRKMSEKASVILSSGRITGSRAEENISFLVREGRDPKSALALLSSGCVRSERAQSELAQTVYEFGSAEDAKAVLDAGKISAPYGIHLLRAKSEGSQEG